MNVYIYEEARFYAGFYFAHSVRICRKQGTLYTSAFKRDLFHDSGLLSLSLFGDAEISLLV